MNTHTHTHTLYTPRGRHTRPDPPRRLTDLLPRRRETPHDVGVVSSRSCLCRSPRRRVVCRAPAPSIGHATAKSAVSATRHVTLLYGGTTRTRTTTTTTLPKRRRRGCRRHRSRRRRVADDDVIGVASAAAPRRESMARGGGRTLAMRASSRASNVVGG